MMKPSPILSHMPWNVMKHIVVVSDSRSRSLLRKCSKQLRSIVDNTLVYYNHLELTIDGGVISLIIWVCLKQTPLADYQSKITCVQYHFHPEGCVIRDRDWEKLIEGRDHISMAVSDLATLIKNPNIHVRLLAFQVKNRNPDYNMDQKILEEVAFRTHIMKLFNSLDHKLNLRGIRTEFSLELYQIMIILSRIKPNALRFLDVKLPPGITELDELTESEHWKHAEQLILKADYYPIHKMSNFSYITLKQPKLSVGDIKMIVEIAQKHGVKFYGYFYNLEYENYSEVRKYLSQWPFHYEDECEFYLIDIPNSNHSLRFHTLHKGIIICRSKP